MRPAVATCSFHDEQGIEVHLDTLPRFQRFVTQLEFSLEREIRFFFLDPGHLNVKLTEFSPVGIPELRLEFPLLPDALLPNSTARTNRSNRTPKNPYRI